MKVKAAQSCPTLCYPTDCPWNSPGQSTRVVSLSFLQEIFPTQGSNPCLPHCKWILYQLSHKGSPWTLEWVAFSSSRGFFQPRNRSGVSCIAGKFFTNWAIREAHNVNQNYNEVSSHTSQNVVLLLFLFSNWVISDSLQPHRLQHARLPCLSLSPGVCSNSCPLSRWCYWTISPSAALLSFSFNPSQHQGLFQWVRSSHQVAKVLEHQLQQQFFQWIFRVDFL